MTSRSLAKSRSRRPGGAVPTDHESRFVALFVAQERTIRSFILTLVPSIHDAEDVLQRSCMVMLKKFAVFAPRDDAALEFRRWACAVALNEVRNFRRERGSRSCVLLDSTVEVLASMHLDQQSGLAELRSARATALRQCLGKLAELDRLLLAMRYEQNLDVEKIAATLGKTVAGVYKRMARAKEQLRRYVRSALATE